MSRLVSRLLIAVVLGLLVYAGFVAYTGYREFRSTLASFEWWTFAAALGLSTANYVLRFGKWEYYLALLGVRGIRKTDSFLIFLSGFVLTVTPGKVGEVFKSAVLARTHGVPAVRTAPIIVAERLTDVMGVIALILIGSVGFAGGLEWALAGAAAVTIGLVCILWSRPSAALVRFMRRGPRRIAGLADKLDEAMVSLRIVASPAALLVPTALSIVGWGAEGLALDLLLDGFRTPTPLTLSMFFYATATLAGALVPVPGGLGVMEAIIQEQLVRIGGAPQAQATAAMILVRFATLWWAVVVGLAAFMALRSRFPSLREGDAKGGIE